MGESDRGMTERDRRMTERDRAMDDRKSIDSESAQSVEVHTLT